MSQIRSVDAHPRSALIATLLADDPLLSCTSPRLRGIAPSRRALTRRVWRCCGTLAYSNRIFPKRSTRFSGFSGISGAVGSFGVR